MTSSNVERVTDHQSQRGGIPKPHIIHVNRQHISMNAKDGGNRPIYTTKHSNGKTIYAREVIINGPSRLVYTGDQLRCGARAWIETTAELTFIDEMTWEEARKA